MSQATQSHSTGAIVPSTGVYTVHHSPHRLTADIVLFRKEIFPRCANCGIPVQFVLDMPVKVGYFPVRTYELPDLEDVGRKDSAAKMG